MAAPALEFDRRGGRSVSHRRKISRRCLGTTAGAHEGVAHPGVELPERLRRRPRRLEVPCAAIQAGGTVEGKGRSSLVGGPGEVIGRSFRLPSFKEMDTQHLRIDCARSLERRANRRW